MQENLSLGFANNKGVDYPRSLRIHEVWSAPLLVAFPKVVSLDLLRAKFRFSS